MYKIFMTLFFFPQVFSVVYFCVIFHSLVYNQSNDRHVVFMTYSPVEDKFNFYSLELEWFLSETHKYNFPFNIFYVFIHFH